MVSQGGARIRSPVAIGTEHHEPTGHPLTDLFGYVAHIVGRRDERTAMGAQRLRHERHPCRFARVEQVPTLAVERLTPKFAETGRAEHLAVHAVIVAQHRGSRDHFTQDRTRPEQRGARRRRRCRGCGRQGVQPLQDVRFHACRHPRHRVVLVHHGDVVEDALAFGVHAPQTILDDHRELVGEGGIVSAAVRHHRREKLAVPVLVLQTLACKRGAASRGTEQEAARTLVAGRPDEVTDPLEPEHRIEDVERHHRHAMVRIGRTRRDPRTHRAGLVDPLLEDLPFLVLAIRHELVGVLRHIELTDRGIDADLAEQPLHPEGARLVRHDRHDVTADLLIFEQRGQHAHERHGGGDLAVLGRLEQRLERLERRHRQRLGVGPTGGKVATQGLASSAHVLQFRAVRRRPRERQVGDLLVGDGDVEAVAESAQVVVRQLLLLVRDHLALARLAHAEPLHRLGEDHGRLATVRAGGGIRRVDLAGIVTAAVQAPDLVVGHVGDHGLEFGELPEEILARVGAAFGLEVLVLTIDALFHDATQQAEVVLREQRIPTRAPQHLDDVPTGAEERSFQFLDDLAVAAHRAVEPLQVAVDDEHQVVEFFAHRHGERAHRFRLVHLAVAEERPYLAVAHRDETAVLQIALEARLEDRLHGTEAHGDRRELPEIRHEPRVRIG